MSIYSSLRRKTWATKETTVARRDSSVLLSISLEAVLLPDLPLNY